MNRPEHDGGRPWDWGRASGDYAAFRDIYPESFYSRIESFGIGLAGQDVLDLGTGTGVIPRAMADLGARWTGLDISEEQILQARRLSSGRENLSWLVAEGERTGLPDASYDAVTAVQCWHYFNLDNLLPELARLLRPGGLLMVGFMTWLPHEDEVAAETEKLVLDRNPGWSGAGWKRRPTQAPSWAEPLFETVRLDEYDEMIPFTAESWRGRIRACRGVGASMNREEVAEFDRDLAEMLADRNLREFDILHQVKFTVLKKAD